VLRLDLWAVQDATDPRIRALTYLDESGTERRGRCENEAPRRDSSPAGHIGARAPGESPGISVLAVGAWIRTMRGEVERDAAVRIAELARVRAVTPEHLGAADWPDTPAGLAHELATRPWQVRQIAGAIRRLRAKGLQLQLDLDDSLGTARWDGERIAQLLGNLLENSLRYTDAPGRVLLRAWRRGEEVQIVVEDSAPGLPPQQLRQLFDPLFRAEASRSRASGGSGLGLSIARALALSHGGRLHAEASALGGLAQCLSLPLVAGGGERA